MEILIIIVLLALASIPPFIASSKGREFFIWFIYSLFLFPFAFIHAIVIKPNEHAEGIKKCPSCASVIPDTAIICPSCRHNFEAVVDQQKELSSPSKIISISWDGVRDISDTSYQLFLTKKYQIEKNLTLEKYVIQDKVFSTLEDSLKEADSREELSIAEIKDTERLQAVESNLLKERLLKEKIIEDERQRLIELENIEKIAIEEKERARLRKIVGSVLVVIFIIGFFIVDLFL